MENECEMLTQPDTGQKTLLNGSGKTTYVVSGFGEV